MFALGQKQTSRSEIVCPLYPQKQTSPSATGRFCYNTQMMLGSATNIRHRLLGLLVFMLASLLGLFLLPPIVQNQNYHDFADQRTLFGIPNFWNVVSNIP